MSSLRLYLLSSGKRLVFPVPASLLSQPIKSLYPLLERQLHVDRVLCLRTTGSFAISSADTISDVLRDGDSVVVVDRKTLLRENLQKCGDDQVKRRISRYTLAEDVSYFFEVGEPIPNSEEEENNAMFVKIVRKQEKKESVLHLELFELVDLLSFGKEGKPLIVSLPSSSSSSSADKWKCVAEFVVDSRGHVTAIEVSLKCDDDAFPVLYRIPVSISTSEGVTFSDSVILSDPNVWRLHHSDYKLPMDRSEGWTFQEEKLKADEEAVQKWNEDKRWEAAHRVETALPVNVKLRQYDVKQSQWYNGKWTNTIVLSYDFLSRSSNTLTFDGFEAEYYSGDWRSVSAYIAYRYGDDSRYSSYEKVDSPWQLGEEPWKVSFVLQFDIDALQNNRRKRVHESLPSPLKLRFRLKECNGGELRISAEVFHQEALRDQVVQPDALVSNNSEEVTLGAVWADDSATMERFGSYLVWRKPSDDQPEDAGYWTVRSPQQGSWTSVGKREFRSLVLKAEKNGSQEEKIDDFAMTESCAEWKREVFALVDRQKRLVYALRMELYTTTSKASKTFFILPDCGK